MKTLHKSYCQGLGFDPVDLPASNPTILFMWARRLSHRLMMAGPFALLIAIGVNGRTPPPMIDETQFGPEAHKQLMRYVRPVAMVESLCSGPAVPSKAQVEALTDVWKGLNDGHRPVTPVDIDTPTQDTVLGEISDAKQALIYTLCSLAASTKDPDEAASLYLDTLVVAEINKYSDFASVQQFAFLQARSASCLSGLVTTMSPETRLRVTHGLDHLDQGDGRLQAIATHLKEIHSLSLSKKGESMTSLELSDTYGMFAQAMAEPAPGSTELLRHITQDSSTPSCLVSASTMARLAIRAEDKYRKAVENLKNELQLVRNSNPPRLSTVNEPSFARPLSGSSESRLQAIRAPESATPSLTGDR